MSKKMFDYVIGNPPYQEETDNTRDKPVYDLFMDNSYKIADKVELITPARFLFNAGATQKNWNKKILNDEHFKVIKFIQDSSLVFDNTDIKGGVAITYRDNDKAFGKIQIFSNFPELNKIRNKLENIKSNSLASIMYGIGSYRFSEKMHLEHPEIKYQEDINGNNIGILSKGHDKDIATNAFEKLNDILFFDVKPKDGNDYIEIVGRKNNERTIMFIRNDYVENHANLSKYKVFLSKANGTGKFGETLSNLVIGKPLMGCTQTFIIVGDFETENEAHNCVKYIKGKFARACLGILKITQDNTSDKWKYVPLQDFTSNSDIDWSKPIHEIDLQLYKKYGLDDKEIEFIESHVKEME